GVTAITGRGATRGQRLRSPDRATPMTGTAGGTATEHVRLYRGLTTVQAWLVDSETPEHQSALRDWRVLTFTVENESARATHYYLVWNRDDPVQAYDNDVCTTRVPVAGNRSSSRRGRIRMLDRRAGVDVDRRDHLVTGRAAGALPSRQRAMLGPV